jgi:hypothetical protein
MMTRLARQPISREKQYPNAGAEPGLVGNGHRPVAIHPTDDIACEREVGPGALEPPANAPWIRGLPLEEAERNQGIEVPKLHQPVSPSATRVRRPARTSTTNGSPADSRSASSNRV